MRGSLGDIVRFSANPHNGGTCGPFSPGMACLSSALRPLCWLIRQKLSSARLLKFWLPSTNHPSTSCLRPSEQGRPGAWAPQGAFPRGGTLDLRFLTSAPASLFLQGIQWTFHMYSGLVHHMSIDLGNIPSVVIRSHKEELP